MRKDKEVVQFDGKPNYEYLLEKGLISQEEADATIKFNELEKKFDEAVINGQYELSDEIMAQMEVLANNNNSNFTIPEEKFIYRKEMTLTDKKIIRKYGQTEVAKRLQKMLKKLENVPPIISDVLLLTKTDGNMKKIIKALENGVTDRDEILYRAICIADGSEYDPTFLEGLDTSLDEE